MAKASKHHLGQGNSGKGAGTGALTEVPDDTLGENMVLSNRDKAQHSDARGLDSKAVQIEQYQDNSMSHRDAKTDPEAGNVTGLTGPMSQTRGDHSSLRRRDQDVPSSDDSSRS